MERKSLIESWKIDYDKVGTSSYSIVCYEYVYLPFFY
jgi:hypothetical protein